MKTLFPLSPTLSQTQFLYSMAETSTFLSSLLFPSIFPPQQSPLIQSKQQPTTPTTTSTSTTPTPTSTANCMTPFSNLESHLDLPFKRHCIACKQVCESQEFYQRHILIQAVVFYQEDDLVSQTCILRNCLSRDFPCPHQPCSQRFCDSEEFKEHVVECEHKKVLLRPVQCKIVTTTNKAMMTKL